MSMKKLLNECAEYIRLHPDKGLSACLLDKIRYELARNEGFAIVSTVSREDILSAGYEASTVDDEKLDRIAESMCEDHTEYGGYWVALRHACENEGVPRCRQSTD